MYGCQIKCTFQLALSMNKKIKKIDTFRNDSLIDI